MNNLNDIFNSSPENLFGDDVFSNLELLPLTGDIPQREHQDEGNAPPAFSTQPGLGAPPEASSATAASTAFAEEAPTQTCACPTSNTFTSFSSSGTAYGDAECHQLESTYVLGSEEFADFAGTGDGMWGSGTYKEGDTQAIATNTSNTKTYNNNLYRNNNEDDEDWEEEDDEESEETSDSDSDSDDTDTSTSYTSSSDSEPDSKGYTTYRAIPNFYPSALFQVTAQPLKACPPPVDITSTSETNEAPTQAVNTTSSSYPEGVIEIIAPTLCPARYTDASCYEGNDVFMPGIEAEVTSQGNLGITTAMAGYVPYAAEEEEKGSSQTMPDKWLPSTQIIKNEEPTEETKKKKVVRKPVKKGSKKQSTPRGKKEKGKEKHTEQNGAVSVVTPATTAAAAVVATKTKPKLKTSSRSHISAAVAAAASAVEKARRAAATECVYLMPDLYNGTAITTKPFLQHEYKEHVKKLSDEAKACERWVTKPLDMHSVEASAEAPVAVVESYAGSIARSIFVYPPRTHQNLDVQRPEKPIADKFPAIKPAAVLVGEAKYLLASALIVRRLRSNRIVLHEVAYNSSSNSGGEWTVRDLGGCATGFTFKTRIADIKWLNTNLLAVANGDSVKVVSRRVAKSLPSVTAQRTSLHATPCEWASLPPTGSSSKTVQVHKDCTIRELDSKPEEPGFIFTGNESGTVMLYDIAGRGSEALLTSDAEGSPVSSVRARGLSEYVYSFTTDSGRLCLCDSRMAWDRPAFFADTNRLLGDKLSSLWTHDWNPAAPGEVVLGYASRAVGSVSGIDIRFPACLVHAKDYGSSVLPFDIQFAENNASSAFRNSAFAISPVLPQPPLFGRSQPLPLSSLSSSLSSSSSSSSGDWKHSNFAIFGERNFAVGNLHSNFDWFTPAEERDFAADQMCVLGCFLGSDTLLTVSDNADLKIWSVLNVV